MRALAFFLGLAAVLTVNDAMSGAPGPAANPVDDIVGFAIFSLNGRIDASGGMDDPLDRVNRPVEIPVLSN